MASPSFAPGQLLACSTAFKEEFLKQYRKLNKKKEGVKIYNQVLTELNKAIAVGDVESFVNLSIFFRSVTEVENRAVLKDYYDNCDNPIKNTNLVILVCKCNQVKILEHVFCSSSILNNLSIDIGKDAISPHDEDDMCHDCFYYAIRSGSVELLEILINKWPGNYFAERLGELADVLSSAYHELKLKNVPLLKEIEFYVESKLLNLHMFSNTFEKNINSASDINITTERIQLVLENINLLFKEYHIDAKKINKRFLYIAKFIAQNIHVLKLLLKSSYDKLPWEEIEFCLISYITSHTKQDANILFNHCILYKFRMLNHLKHFGDNLKKYALTNRDITKLPVLPNLKREDVVKQIIDTEPHFQELYLDHQQIKDIYSLQIINHYIKLSVSVDPKEREGQLVVARTLQVLGVYLKNTLEFPNLSTTTSEWLLLTLPKNTREVVTDMIHSLSLSYLVERRNEIENMDINFFTCVQKDVKQIGSVISDFIFRSKVKVIIILLKNIINSKNLDEIREFLSVFSYVNLDEFSPTVFKTREFENIEMLIEKLGNAVLIREEDEQKFFEEINNIINFEKNKLKNTRIDSILEFSSLKVLSLLSNDDKIWDKVEDLKYNAMLSLNYLTPKIDTCNLKKITELALKFCNSASYRVAFLHTSSCQKVDSVGQPVGLNSFIIRNPDEAMASVRNNQEICDEINRIFFEIFNVAQFLIGNTKWTEELKKKLYKRSHFILVCKQITSVVLTEEKYSIWLKAHIAELKSILSKNGCNIQSNECFSIYKNNKKLQAVVEMLVLDIISILDISNFLDDNVFHLGDTVPLLIGKCLCNHLEHYNVLVDVLVFDPLIAVLVNAQNCTSENILQNKKKFGKSVLNNTSKLKDKKNNDLVTIANQESLFIALECGDVKELKICLKKGGDIQSRSIDICTAWHFVAKGSSLENIKLILTELNLIESVNVKDIHGRNPLHIAAAYGGKGFVDFFVKDAEILVNNTDNSGKTPLHIASVNGHKDTVESLLGNKADIAFCDKNGLTALYYAIRNGHIDVVKILFEKETNIDLNETRSGFFPLHEAAGRGFLEIVIFLFQNGAKIDMKDDQDWTPLFSSTFNRHMEVVRYLISNDADVNIRGMGGATPLFYAVQNGEEEMVNILLKHGAQANVLNKTLISIPSVYSATDGHGSIFETLLATNAHGGILFEGVTPMHIAAKCGHINIVAVFLEHGFDIDVRSKNNSTLLHYAAYMGHKSVVDLLIKHKALVNAKDYSGFTPLHVAASKGHAEVVDLLMTNKAEVNDRTKSGVTPLHLAALNGKNYTIEILIKNNADVNKKDNNNKTPLYPAVQNGHKYSITLLLKNNAEVNSQDNDVTTPLHVAAMKGYKDIIELLINHNAKVHIKDKFGRTPLHLAIEEGHKDAVDTLIENGALNNMGKDDKRKLLSIAVVNNSKQIVEVLIAKGVNVNFGFILSAVFSGYSDIVKLFLKNKSNIFSKQYLYPLLFVAAERGYKEIMCDLIKHGADVNVIAQTVSPMFLAAKEGHSEVVELLIANGANIDIEFYNGLTPLYTAATLGHDSVVKVLLDNNADINVTQGNETPITAAIVMHHLQVVKIMLKHREINVNSKGQENFTLLHVAAQVDYVGMVKCLIQEGADIHAKSISGAKPIHIAASNGFKSTVEFLISKGSSISDIDFKGQTVLHYAANEGHFELVEYLVEEEKCNVNVQDVYGFTPLHHAALLGHEDVVVVLLENGAIYNSIDMICCKPETVEYPKVANMLIITDSLFTAVKNNSPTVVYKIIQDGGFVNAKNAENGTPLHYAAWKGYIEVVKVLLKYKSNPNAVHTKGFTPLHYAAKFSHLEIVKVLLHNGAMYNVVSDTGKTPSDIAVGNSIINLLNILNEAFKNVKSNNPRVINDIKNMKDINTVKAVLNACNKENKTLVVSAIFNNFSMVDQLKEILQGDVSSEIDAAFGHFSNHNMAEALHIFRRIFENRKEIFGPDNPATLDIQSNIASIYFAQGAYEEALNLYEDIFDKEKEMFGKNHKDTLKTRNAIALTLFRQQKPEALDMFKENYCIHIELLGPNHGETLKCQLYIAMILHDQEKYDQALHLSEETYRKRKKLSQVTAMRSQINMAQVIAHQGKLDEAFDIYNEVLEQRRIYFDDNHIETLRTSRCIAELLFMQKKYPEALKANKELLDTLNKVLEPNHIEILFTKYNMANVLFAQCKWIQSLIIYKELFHIIKASLGATNPCVKNILRKIELIHIKFKCESSIKSDEDKYYSTHELHRKYISIAANNGDIQTMYYLVKNGVDVNDKDTEGRTPLHYVCNNGYNSIVKYLLENGADPMQATNKGNTPLHTAVSKGYIEIVRVLLQHVSCDKLNNFINAQTTTGGNTSLHVAAKNGSLEIVLYLLEYGAIYNIKNKEGCLPLGISSNKEVGDMLKLLEELFDQTKAGDIGITSKLKAVHREHISAVTNAQDDSCKTLLQVAIAKKHQRIASEILRTLYIKLKKTC